MGGSLITRRQALAAGAGLLGAAAGVVAQGSDQADWLLQGGQLFDGSGAAPQQADLAIKDGHILAIGGLEGMAAKRRLNLRGLAVAPGFIDLHSHSDLALLQGGRALSKLYQGVTTEVIGQDGRSLAPLSSEQASASNRRLEAMGIAGANWLDFAGMVQRYDAAPLYANVVFLAGAGQLRRQILGDQFRPAAPLELARMTAAGRAARQAGVAGLSSGLEYPPGAYATRRELIALARQMGLYVTHMRNEDDRVLEALDEALSIAQNSGARLHVSHLKAQGRRNWPKQAEMLRRLAVDRNAGAWRSFDAYPYNAYSVSLISLLPVWARLDPAQPLGERLHNASLRERMAAGFERKIQSLDSYDAVLLSDLPHPDYRRYEGARLGQLAAALDKSPFDLVVEILDALGPRAAMIGFAMSEQNVAALMSEAWCAIASDGAALPFEGEGRPHPRNFSAFPRAIRFARDEGAASMQEMIRRMTSLPAAIVGLQGRGLLSTGFAADIVAFDPLHFRDRGDYLHPRQKPEGLAHVFVNGAPMILNGNLVAEGRGRPLRGAQWQ
ncbi:MAG: amidohydrolase family protein [Leptospirales bacterium]|nr:amidohydrolase family protein [Leptospirales bacterium]